jgi:hypothetical protein
MSSPAHIELVAEEQAEEVAKEAESSNKLSKKQAAQLRSKGKVAVGGGV